MKLSDYVAQRLADNGVRVVFGYQGSSISHTIDSVASHDLLKFVTTRHEQAAAFAANSYALSTNQAGVAIACSGPGATNLITGIADAYYDSLPCLFITGQVSTPELRTDLEMRQLGFQETDIVSIVKPITKYAVTVRDANQIAIELERAFYYMREGRPGPVLLDIPHNVQGSQIDLASLQHEIFTEEKKFIVKKEIDFIVRKLKNSKRPVILLGGGSRELIDFPELRTYIENLGIPLITSYRGKDVVDNLSEDYLGTLGVYGDRCANWAAHYCDFLLVLGSRLDGRQTGDGKDSFAPNADVFLLDIDDVELRNMPERYNKVCCSVSQFVTQLYEKNISFECDAWRLCVKKWRKQYLDDAEYVIEEGVNPNVFFNLVSKYADENAVFTVDVGQNQLWANTSLKVKSKQKLLQSCGLGSMGFAIPAAIGAFFSDDIPYIVCICGDGGFQMNSQELQTIAHYKIPVKIFVLNNQSLGLIRIYQDKALRGNHYGSVIGFDSPDYSLLANAYGLEYKLIQNNDSEFELKEILESKNSFLIEVQVSNQSTNYPEPTYQSTIINQSIELKSSILQQVQEDAYGIQ